MLYYLRLCEVNCIGQFKSGYFRLMKLMLVYVMLDYVSLVRKC